MPSNITGEKAKEILWILYLDFLSEYVTHETEYNEPHVWYNISNGFAHIMCCWSEVCCLSTPNPKRLGMQIKWFKLPLYEWEEILEEINK